VPALVAAGVTDFRAFIRLPREKEATTERLADIVTAFREATEG